MIERYKYKGQQIEIRTNQKSTDPDTWELEIWITGVRHLLMATDVYPPKLFPTSEEAMNYGKEAAEYIIDQPIKTNRKPQA